MLKDSVRGHFALPGLIVAIAVANPSAVPVLRLARQTPQQAEAQYQYALGNVTISIPPPKGFEEVLSRVKDMRDRMPDTDRLETLAAHLPADVVKTYAPGQDLTFYTKVSISKAAKTSDVPETLFADLKNKISTGNVFDSEALRKYLAGVQQQRGITMTQPIQLGIVDQTPQSITTLMLMTIGDRNRRIDVLSANSTMYLRRRLFFVYSYRVFETTKDIATLTAFTKDWVGSIVAVNP
jgi:hypothetical protein